MTVITKFKDGTYFITNDNHSHLVKTHSELKALNRWIYKIKDGQFSIGEVLLKDKDLVSFDNEGNFFKSEKIDYNNLFSLYK